MNRIHKTLNTVKHHNAMQCGPTHKTGTNIALELPRPSIPLLPTFIVPRHGETLRVNLIHLWAEYAISLISVQSGIVHFHTNTKTTVLHIKFSSFCHNTLYTDATY